MGKEWVNGWELTAKSITMSSTVAVLRINFDLERHVQTTVHIAGADTISSRMLGACILLALVQRRVAILSRLLGREAIGGAGDLAICRRGVNLGDTGVVPRRHGGFVGGGALLDTTGLLVDEVHESFVGVLVEMVKLVALGEQVRHCFRRWLVGDGAADDVDDKARVAAAGDAQFGARIEPTNGRQVDVTSQNCHPDRMGLGEVLQTLDEHLPFLLVLARCVVVVQVVQQIDLAVELVEQTTREAEALVQQTDGGDEWRAEDVLQPCQTGVGDGDTQKDDQVLDIAVSRRHFTLETGEEKLIGVLVIDLVARTLRASIHTDKRNPLAQTHVQVPTPFFNVRPRTLTDDPAVVFYLVFQDVRVFQLSRVGTSSAVDGRHGFGSICGEGRQRRSDVVLEEAVVLESHATNTPEDRAAHKVVCVRTKAINNVVIVPDVDLGDLRIGRLEGFRVVPADIVGVVVVIAASSHFLVKVVRAALVRVRNRSPLIQRTVYANPVIVNLVTTSNHTVEGLSCVHPQHIIPQTRANPCVHVRANGETIAGMEHHPHGLVRCGHHEAPGGRDRSALHVLQTRNVIFPTGLIFLDGHGDGETPESLPGVFEKPQAANHPARLVPTGLSVVACHGADLAQTQLRWLQLTGFRHKQDASMPE